MNRSVGSNLAHTDKLVELLAQQRDAIRMRKEPDTSRLTSEIQAAVQKCAEDFGERAGAQLLAYARKEMLRNDSPVAGSGRNQR